MNANRFCLFAIFCFMLFVCSVMNAQPSGGPYGPVPQTYQLPKDVHKIFYVSPNGDEQSAGGSIESPTTLESAFEKVVAGDAIVLRGGIYRTGDLVLNQQITMQPYNDEQPIIKGTLVASDWKNLGNGLWKTKWSHLFPSKPADWWVRDHDGKTTPLCRFNNDMVFADGAFLHAVGWEGEVDQSSYYIDYETGFVYIALDPAKHVIEITAHDAALIRTTKECHGKKSDGKGPIIRGLAFSQYAYRAIEIEGNDPEGLKDESTFGKEIVGTTLENCSVTFCSRVGIYLRGDHTVLRQCKVSDTRTEGVYIIGSNDVLFEKNIFTRNNIDVITGYFPAAVKIFDQCHRVTVQDNLVIDLPHSNGVWFDVGNVDGKFINNWVEGVGSTNFEFPQNQLWPSDNGFFFEISKGVTVAGNVFVNCDHGLMILNSSNARIYQNTFINSTACIGRNARVAAGDHFGWHPSTGPDVEKREGHVFVNNILTGDAKYRRPLMAVWQPDSLYQRLPKSQLKQIDDNVFVRDSSNAFGPLIYWSVVAGEPSEKAFASFVGIQNLYPALFQHCQYIPTDNNQIFLSRDLKNYQLLHSFPGSRVPSDIATSLGLQDHKAEYIGAYPEK
ncbi:MAG TPA: right-handed parallel beta-helix repeat-containing protein [Bacteroidota bacterium]|nr:right-handed parallel beta-helix repeat-containing protein [Bacteroidota bacterium]